MPALAVAGWAIATQPDATAQMGLRLPFLVVFIPLVAEICFASVSLAATVPSENSIHFRRSMWLVPGLISAEAAAALYLGAFWSLFGTLIILLLVNIAMRQRLIAELPWISEPSDAPPRRLDAAHALITLGGFLQLRDMLGGLIRGNTLTAETAALIAFAASAVAVALLFLFWKWQTGTRFETTLTARPVFKPLTIGLSVALLVGLIWVSVLHQSAAITAVANRTLRLPTSLEEVDAFTALRLAALLLVAPVFEEWLFRGLLYRSLRRSYSVLASVLFSALLFMVIHPIDSSVGVLTLAVVTAVVYERTGRLSAAIAVHFCYNLAVMGLWTAWPPVA